MSNALLCAGVAFRYWSLCLIESPVAIQPFNPFTSTPGRALVSLSLSVSFSSLLAISLFSSCLAKTFPIILFTLFVISSTSFWSVFFL